MADDFGVWAKFENSFGHLIVQFPDGCRTICDLQLKSVKFDDVKGEIHLVGGVVGKVRNIRRKDPV